MNQNNRKNKVIFENTLFSEDVNQTEEFNKKYFRPSCLPALNIRNLNDLIIKIHNENPALVTVPKELMNSYINTIINYYSILREATNDTSGAAGCGTIGMVKLPYPVAYNFLSNNYKQKLSYEEYLKSFGSISHINLIKAIRNHHIESSSKNIETQYYIELEYILPPGNFQYSFGTINLIKEDDIFKINNIELSIEDFFCAPYHLWRHNAELKIDIMYGEWCKLIAMRYPTIQSDYKKKIYIKGTDGNNYLFTFIKLTNGTDFEIGQYMQSSSGKWIPINLNPHKCLENKTSLPSK